MTSPLSFLPQPRQVSFGAGVYALAPGRLILLDAPHPQELRSAGLRLQAALEQYAGLRFELAASNATPAEQVAITLRVSPERTPFLQGYRLHVTGAGAVVEGHDPAGVFYGACTLIQALMQAGASLPHLEIIDWPDIPARGVMLDISRDRVYRMETLYELVDRLAGWKINQVQLYTEHTFAYRAHPDVWEHASPMTGDEILALDAFCRERFIELVPNQNSFGHMHRWLTHPRYADLAETHGDIHLPWGGVMKGPFSIAPENPGSFALIQSLYDELLPHFTSRLFNVGCDETFDLGAGATREAVEQRGEGRVYLDFLLKVYADVKRRGFTMQFWGDIILRHPELVPLLPRDVIALSWGYDSDHPFAREAAAFEQSGVPFYVCPGTSTWTTLAGRTDNALENLLNAAENGTAHGAIGYLNTDWGDNGHWQTPPISLLGFAGGAALSWAVDANRANDWKTLLSRFAFEDPSGAMGQVAYDLGNVYKQLGIIIPNASALFWILYKPMNELLALVEPYGLDAGKLKDGMEAGLDAIDAAMAPLAGAKMARPDADLIRREFTATARLMRHACMRAMLAVSGHSPKENERLAQDMSEYLAEYKDLWLARSRPGGLSDSVKTFEQVIKEYRQGA